MWSQFPPNFQNNLPENNVEPVPSKFDLPPKQSFGKYCGASSLQIWAASKKNLPDKNVEQVPTKVSPYFIFWKMKIMNYIFWQISSLNKLWPEKLQQEKKGTVLGFLASVLECHHISYVEKWKLWDIYLLTLNKKRKMKIMGKVARLILVVAVSVCVVCCVLCCFQNNPVFLSVTIFHEK